MSNEKKISEIAELENQLVLDIEAYRAYSKDDTISDEDKHKKLVMLQLTIGNKRNRLKELRGE